MTGDRAPIAVRKRRGLLVLLNLAEKPRTGVSPIAVGGADGNAQNVSRFVNGHADKVTELYDFRLHLVLSGKFVNGIVYGKDLVIICNCRYFQTFKVHALVVASVTHRALVTGFVNEDTAHGLGGDRKEMGAVGKLGFPVPDQMQPRLMHQRGGLQGLIGGFAGHFRPRKLAQLAINQRQQFLGGLRITLLDGFKNAGNLVQSLNTTKYCSLAPANWAASQACSHTTADLTSGLKCLRC